MKIFSLTLHNFELEAFEVEVSLMPGLPQISILGQADALVRESIPKIRSALKSQGYKIPKAQHILVNLKPQSLKKGNEGLELAIATAILYETKQIELKSEKPWLIIGHLGLKGEVIRAYDRLDDFKFLKDYEILTGPQAKAKFAHFEIQNLKDLNELTRIKAQEQSFHKIKPRLPDIKFSKSASRLIQILASGEHSALLAGSVGSGKSTIATTTAKLIEPLRDENAEEVERIQRHFNSGDQVLARPEVNVHHSISTMAFLGGGAQLHPGEITRAHKGVLIMDEFMQFHSEIQNALREPLEHAKLSVARNGQYTEFPADIFLIATTNLCNCGDFAMNSPKACRCSQYKMKNYLSKLNGSCIDRFQILAFSPFWDRQEKEITTKEIAEKITDSIQFRIRNRNQNIPNSKIKIDELSQTMDHQFIDEYFRIDLLSERRQLSLKRVARSIADLEASERVRIQHVNEARELTMVPFQWLEQAQKASVAI